MQSSHVHDKITIADVESIRLYSFRSQKCYVDNLSGSMKAVGGSYATDQRAYITGLFQKYVLFRK